MKISNQPLVPGEPVKFIVTGFPEEIAVKASLERFYTLSQEADRRFITFNIFEEQIFSGSVDAEGKIASFESLKRSDKPQPKELKKLVE